MTLKLPQETIWATLPTLFLLLISHISLTSQVTMNLNSATSGLEIGETFIVTVTVESGSIEVTGAQVNVNFDPAVFQVNSVTPNTLNFESTLVTPDIDNTGGSVEYSRFNFAPLTGSNELMTIEFEAISSSVNSEIGFNFTNSEPTTTSVTSANNGTNLINENPANVNPIFVTVNAIDVDISVVPQGNTSVQLSDNFMIDVNIMPNGQPVDAGEVTLNFDPAVLQVVGQSIDISTFNLIFTNPITVDNVAGTINYQGGTLPQFPTNTFKLFSLEFEAIALSSGTDIYFVFNSPDATLTPTTNVSSNTMPQLNDPAGDAFGVTYVVLNNDGDGDGILDADDNCPNGFNPGQEDTDSDGTGDVCDPDDDNDGVLDNMDSATLNPFVCQDLDGDGCDDCAVGVDGFGPIADANPVIDGPDADGDGTCDSGDACPNDPNKITPGDCGCGVDDFDSDTDGTADCNDLCPNDPSKIDPGICGCGEADVDSDNDGTLDCDDECPSDPFKIFLGQCGCGVPDIDTDGDGIQDCIDNCPTIANPMQENMDMDPAGDVCDCQPGEPTVYPGASEIPNDGIDQDCMEGDLFVQVDDVYMSVPLFTQVPVLTEIDVPVSVVAGAQSVDVAQVHLDYDPAVLELVSITPVLADLDALVLNNTATLGEIDYHVVNIVDGAPSGTFVIFIARFRGLVPTVSTPLTFSTANPRETIVALAGNNTLTGVIDGAMEVEDVTRLDGMVEYQRSFGLPIPAMDPTYVAPLTIKLYTPESTNQVYSSSAIMTDLSATFSLEGIPNGTYDVAIKHSHTLQKMFPSVNFSPPMTSFDFGLLLEGDANNNNATDILDFSILAASFGKVETDLAFDDRADFNENGEVELLDFSLLSTNYLMSGDEPPLPGMILLPEELNIPEAIVNVATHAKVVYTQPGDVVTIPIYVAASNVNVNGVQMGLDFNPDLLEVLNINYSEALPEVLSEELNNDLGNLSFATGDLTASVHDGNFLLAEVEVLIKKEFAGNVLSLATDQESEVASQGVDVFKGFTDNFIIESRKGNATRSIHLFPNPFEDVFFIELEGFDPKEKVNVEVIDNLGRVWMYTKQIVITSADKRRLSFTDTELVAGIYHLTISSEVSGFEKRIRIVKN